jgi:hypothetical protein
MKSQLLKYEFVYTGPIWVILFSLLLVFTAFSLFDFQILSGPAFEVDYWGALYTMFLSMFLIIIASQKIKEYRLRMHMLLPLDLKTLAKVRFYFYGLPMVLILLYVVVIHLLILSNWKDEASTLLAQSGLFFTLFLAFLNGRDIWIINESKKMTKRIFPIIIIGISLLSIVILTTYSLPFIYKAVPIDLARFTFLYSKIIFYVMAFIFLLTLLITFKKRHSYFS